MTRTGRFCCMICPSTYKRAACLEKESRKLKKIFFILLIPFAAHLRVY
jgi:hypothetical protein